MGTQTTTSLVIEAWALIVSVVSLFFALIALGVSVYRTRQVKRSAEAAERSAKAAERSAGASEASAKLAADWPTVEKRKKEAEVAGRCAAAVSQADNVLLFYEAHHQKWSAPRLMAHWERASAAFREYDQCLELARTHLPKETHDRLMEYNKEFVESVERQRMGLVGTRMTTFDVIDPLLDDLRALARYGQPGGYESLTAVLRKKYGKKDA